MQRREKVFDKASREHATYMAKQRIKHTLDLAEKLKSDPEKASRVEQQLCKACHYFPRMAGQVFTEQPCGSCGEPQMYSSTATDILCSACATTHGVCKRCGGDLN
jgi:LSD1 subclass zinc finger protein